MLKVENFRGMSGMQGNITGRNKVIIQPSTVWYSILLFLVSAFAMPLIDVFEKDWFIGIQFVIIAIISIVALIKENEKHSFSLTLCFYFFCYLFYYCAGTYQFANDTFRWYLFPSHDEVIQGNFIIIIGLISFIIGHFYQFKSQQTAEIPFSANFRINHLGLGFLLLILFMYTCYLFSFHSLSDFFMRATFSAADSDNQISGLLVGSFRNGIVLMCCMTFISIYKRKRTTSSLIGMIGSLLLALFTIPPTGVARFLSGAFYGAIVLYAFPTFSKGRKFLTLMFFFLLIIFPLLNNFRFTDGNILSVFDVVNGLSNNFQAADFDAYTMLLYTVQYVSDYGYTYGNQMLGTLGFFIPRSIWGSKPIGTGNMIVDSMLIPVPGNLSEPIFAEFYINFSYIGLIIFSVILGCILKTVDHMYWHQKQSKIYLQMIYPFLSLITIFICRGDLMSTFSFCLGTICTSFFAYKLIYRKVIS